MKINLTTLGCPKNIVDSEILLGGLKGEDIEIVENPLEAETIILNTCGFIQGAKEESIDAILQAVELKKRGDCEKVFVTGCLSQRYQAELVKEISDESQNQRQGAQKVNGVVNELDGIVRQNSVMAEEMNASSIELNGLAVDLKEAVEFFKLD